MPPCSSCHNTFNSEQRRCVLSVKEPVWKFGESDSIVHNYWYVMLKHLHVALYKSCTNNLHLLTGIFHTYILVQISMWVLFHAMGILGGVGFPFKYRKFKAEGKFKYIHISTVVITIILPLVPALLLLIDGYSIIPASLDVCFGRNVDLTYFTLVLPFSILFALATTILIAMFWKIVKVMQEWHTIYVVWYNKNFIIGICP